MVNDCDGTDIMADTQISTAMSTWRLQAKDFLEEARRMKPGPKRNELREMAKVLRAIAKLDEQSADRAKPGEATGR